MVSSLVLALAFGSACSDDDAPSSTFSASSRASGDSGPLVVGHFTLTGGVDLSGEFTVVYPLADERLNRCDRIASSANAGYVIPTPNLSGDARMTWRAAVRSFHGAGLYTIDAIRPLRVEIRTDPNAAALTFTDGSSSKMSMTVDDHNSGTMEFSGLQDDSGAQLSGKFSWTCD